SSERSRGVAAPSRPTAATSQRSRAASTSTTSSTGTLVSIPSLLSTRQYSRWHRRTLVRLCGVAYDTGMAGPQVVLDSCVLVSALRSRRGASYLLLTLVDSGRFELNLSVPLVLEYEEACKRLVGQIPLTSEDITAVLDYLCQVGHHRRVSYLWRPFLRDPDDDMVLEAAVAGGCDY